MAEEQQQSKGIGELFVEFGVKGLGSLLKGLNGVSAQFLLTKNAAQQAIKPIVDMSQKAAGTVVAWDKLSTVMGMSLQELQDIEIFSKLNNIEFSSYISQIQTVQQKLMDIRTGQSDDGQLTLLGLTAYDFDPKKPLEFMDKVKQRVLTLDEVTAASALRWLGLSQDLLYAWKQQNNQFNNRLKLNDKEIESLREQQTSWNILKTTWWGAQNKFIANQSVINNLLKKTTDWLVGMHPLIDDVAKNFNKWLDEEHPYFDNLLKSLHWLLTTSAKEKRQQTSQGIKDTVQNALNLQKESVKYVGNELNNPQTLQKYLEAVRLQQAEQERNKQNFLNANPQLSLNNGVPSFLLPTNNSVAYNVNITQNITGTEANQIATLSANNIEDSFLTLQAQNQFNV